MEVCLYSSLYMGVVVLVFTTDLSYAIREPLRVGCPPTLQSLDGTFMAVLTGCHGLPWGFHGISRAFVALSWAFLVPTATKLCIAGPTSVPRQDRGSATAVSHSYRDP